MPRKILLIVGLWMTTCTIGVSQQSASGDEEMVIDKIVAKVDDYVVLKSDLEKNYMDYLSQGQGYSPDLKCRILENLVVNKLMLAVAEIDSVVVGEEEVEANLNRRLQYFISQVGSEKRLESMYGKTVREFKDDLRGDVREQMIVQRMRGKISEGIDITPAEVKRFFNNIPKDSVPYFSTEVVFGQIVIDPKVSTKQKEQAKRKLADIRERIVSGEASFAQMAKEHSQDPGSARNGGNLGFRKRGELVPEYEATAMKLNAGEISKPIESQFGVHLIQLVERRGNEFNSRHILIKPESSTLDFEEAATFLDSLRMDIMNDSISFEKAAKEHSDDNATAGNGGFFTDQTGSNRVSVEEIESDLFFTLDTMEVGTISKPRRFTKQNGDKAMRILYFKEKFKPHEATYKGDYQKIRHAALNEKKSKAMNKWFEDAKDEVFISIDPEYEDCKILE